MPQMGDFKEGLKVTEEEMSIEIKTFVKNRMYIK